MMNSWRNLVVTVLAIPCCCTAALAGERVPMLPSDLKDRSLDLLFDVGERPIWPQAPHNTVVRYRVSFIGIRCAIHVVRFDEWPDGSARGEVKVWDRCKRDESYDAHDFWLRRSQFTPVKDAMTKAGLWQRPASYWSANDKESICVDGVEVTFERRDRQDFRMDTSNVWCGTTRAYIFAARSLLIAADDRSALSLLPGIGDDH